MATLNYREIGVREVEDGKIEFEVLPEHVKLLRSAKVKWNPGNDGNTGAPTIDPVKPYGLNDLAFAMEELLSTDDYTFKPEEFGDKGIQRLHQGTAVALQIAIVTGKFKAGVFRTDKYNQNWKEYRPKKEKPNANNEATVSDTVEADSTDD